WAKSASPSRDSHTARLLLVQAAVGRVLHEGLVEHPAHLVALHLLVRRPEDADRVGELVRPGVRQRREDLHDVVVRLREDLLVVDLQLLLQHGDRAGLVLAEGGDRLHERVDVPLHDGAVGGRVAPLHDEAVVHDRQLQARHVEERVQTLRLELVAERRLVEATLDRAGLQRGGPVLRGADGDDGDVLVRIEPFARQPHTRRDVGGRARRAHADLLALELLERSHLGRRHEDVRVYRNEVADQQEVRTLRVRGERLGPAALEDLDLVREQRGDAGRARREAQVRVDEVLGEDALVLRVPHGERALVDLAEAHDDLGHGRLRRRRRGARPAGRGGRDRRRVATARGDERERHDERSDAERAHLRPPQQRKNADSAWLYSARRWEWSNH